MTPRAAPPRDVHPTIDLTQPGPCEQAVRIQMGTEGIRPVREAVVREFQREVTLAGFRKGKAPRELIERQYPGEIREETIRRLTRELFERVTTERHLKPVGPFEVTKLEFDDAQGLQLEAHVEVEPEFRLDDYRGLRLTKPPVAVTAQEVNQALAKLQESAAQLVPANDATSSTEKVKQLPHLDDEFAKDLGFDNLDALKQHVEAKLREQRQAEQQQALEQALFEALLARHRFEVPPGLVARQAERLQREFQTRLLLAGTPEEKVNEEIPKYVEHLRRNAAQHVKLAFILARIAEAEQLSVAQEELMDRLWKLAQRWGKEPGEVRRILDAKGLWSSVISSIRQDNTVQFLLSVSQIDEGQTPVKQTT